MQYKELHGGLSFYRSNFNVCDEWKKDDKFSNNKLSLKNDNPFKVLILSGGFDPITPNYFAKETAENFNQNVEIVNAYTYGHGLGYTRSGANIIKNFIENKPISDSLKIHFDKKNVNFRTDIAINKGIVMMVGDITSKQWYYFVPLIISLSVIFIVFVFSIIQFFSKGKKLNILISCSS
jgi:hypothetical protein